MNFFRDEIDNIKLFKNQLKGELTVVISDTSLIKEQTDKSIIINKAKNF